MSSTIHVLGWYGHQNIGDEAYKIAIPKLFKNKEFTFGEEVIGKPETIILGGGDVLHPRFLKMLDKHPQAKKYLLSVNLREKDIGPHLAQFDRIISRNIIKSKDYKIECYPDFTFILEPNKENGKRIIEKLFKKHHIELYKNVVALTLNSFLCCREKMLARDYVTFDKICYDLAKLMDNTNASFILLPFGNGMPQNDRISNSFVYANCKFWGKNLLVFENLSIQNMLDVFAAVDAAITSRLHAAIFSCIGDTPFFDITHHSKNKMFMEFIGKTDWSFDFYHFNYPEAFKLLEDFLNNKETYEVEINRINAWAKQKLSILQNGIL